jgi:hypothetical protein
MENVSENKKSSLKLKPYEFRKLGFMFEVNYLTELLEFDLKSNLRNTYKNK